MPSNIDNRIVNMQFNNKQFESGVAQTMSTLDKFKEKLNMSKSATAFNDLEKAANKVSFSGLKKSFDSIGDATEAVSLKFNAWHIAAKRAIENVVDSAQRAAEKFVKSLSVDQITDGWTKYGEVASSVATIMSATGLSVEDVTAQLERLNWYTDETSYSYKDMADNISKFTSQDIPLDSAMEQMMGIANWAALAGQSANEASRAMYNISQAMGQGYMQLMDWRSIQNANMATSQFKELAIDTAASLGYLQEVTDKTGKKYITFEHEMEVNVGNFANTLSEKWLTSDVMEEIFKKYGKFATRLNEILTEINDADNSINLNATDFLQMLDEYADTKGLDRAKDAVRGTGIEVKTLVKYFKELTSSEYELSRKAFAMAQEYRTFNDAISATKDAVSTQWMSTFQYVFGNYEEAKELWTALGNSLYDLFAEAGNERNAVLREWRELGGRDDLVEAITMGLETIVNVVGAVKKGIHMIFPELDAERLQEIVGLFRNFIDSIHIGEEDTTKLLKITQAVTMIVSGFRDIFVTVFEFVKTIKDAFSEVFLKNFDRTVRVLIYRFAVFASNLVPSEDTLKDFKQTLLDVFGVIKPIIGFLGKVAGKALNGIVKIGSSLFSILMKVARFAVGAIWGIVNWFKSLGENTKFSDSIERLRNAFRKLFSVIGGKIGTFTKKIGKFFDKINENEKVNDFLEKFTEILIDVVSAVADFLSSGIEGIADFLGRFNLIEKATEIWDKFSDAIVNAYHAVSDFFAPAADWISEKAESIWKSVTDFFAPAGEKVDEFFQSFTTNDPTGSLGKISEAIKNFGESISNWASSLWEKITQKWIPGIKTWIKEHLPNLYDSLVKIRDWFSGFGKSDNKFQYIIDGIKQFNEAVGEFGGKVWETLKKVWKWLKEEFNNIGPAGIVLAAFAGGLLALMLKLSDVLVGLYGPISGLVATVKSFAEAGKKMFEAAKINQLAQAVYTIANAIKTLAIAFAILVVSISILSKTDVTDRAIGLLIGFAGAIIVLIGAIAGLNAIKNKKGKGGAVTDFNDMAKMLLATAISLFAFVAVIKKAGLMDADEFWAGFFRTLASMILVVGAIKKLSKKGGGQTVIKGALAILAIAIAIDFLVKTMAKIQTKGSADVINKFILLAGIALALGVLGKAFGKVEKTSTEYKGITTNTAARSPLLGITALLLAFVYTLKELHNIDLSDVQVVPILVAVGLGIAALAILSKATEGASGNIIKLGVGLLAIAKSIDILINVITMMGDLDGKWKNIAIVGGMFILLVAAMSILIKAAKLGKDEKSGAVGAALELAALAGALTLLAAVMGVLSFVSWKKLIAPAAAMFAFLIGLAAVIYAATKATKEGTVQSGYRVVIAAGILIAIVGAVIGVLAAIGTDKIKPAANIVMAVIGLTAILIFALGWFNKNTTVNVEEKRIKNAAMDVMVAALVIAGLAVGLFFLAKALDPSKTSKLPDFAKALLITAVAVGIVAGALILLEKNLPEKFGKSMGRILIGFAAFFAGAVALVIAAGALWVISKILTTETVISAAVIAKPMIQTVLAVGIISEILIIFAKEIGEVNKAKWGSLGSAIAIFAVGCVLLVGVAFVLWGVASILENVKTLDLSMFAGLGLTIVAVTIVSEALMLLSKQIGEVNKAKWSNLGSAIAIFASGAALLIGVAAVLLAVTKILTGVDALNLSMFAGLAITAVIVGLVAEVLTVISVQLEKFKVTSDKVVGSLGVFMAAALMILVVATFLGGIDDILKNVKLDESIYIKMGAIAAMVAVIGVAAEALTLLSAQIGKFNLKTEDMLRGLAAMGFGVIVTAVAGLLVWLLNDVVFQNGVDLKGTSEKMLLLVEAIGVMTLATAAVIGLGQVAGNNVAVAAKAAVAGIVAIAIVLVGFAILAGVMAAVEAGIGALGGNLTEYLEKGFEIIGVIAEGIGTLAGKLVGGFLEGAFIDAIPVLGQALGDFWINAEPFFSGLRDYGEELPTLIGYFSAAIVALTVAELINGLATVLTLGGNLVSFVATMQSFGEGITAFDEAIKDDISPTRVKSFAETVVALVTAMAGIPTEGGIASWFTGNADFSGFADNVIELANGLNAFSEETANLGDTTSIGTAVAALRLIAGLAPDVEKYGDSIGYYVDGNNWTSFGDSIGVMGSGLKTFCWNVKNLDTSGVSPAVDALKEIGSLSDVLGQSGGTLQIFMGDTDFAKFADNLPALGRGLYRFTDWVTSMYNTGGALVVIRAKRVISLVEDIANLQGNLDKEGGAWQWLSGTTGTAFENLSANLGSLGKGLYDFTRNMKDVNGTDFDNAIDMAGRFMDVASRVTLYNLDTNLDVFNTTVVEYAEAIMAFINKTKDYDHEATEPAIQFARDFIEVARNSNFSVVNAFADAFKNLSTIDISAFLKTFNEAELDAQVAGAGFMAKFFEGIDYTTNSETVGIVAKANGVVNAFINAIKDRYGSDSDTKSVAKKGSETIVSVGKTLMDKLLTGMGNGAPYSSAKTIGENIDQGLIDGMDFKRSKVNDKAAEIGRDIIMTIERITAVRSPSKEGERIGRFIDIGLINGLNEYSDGVAAASAGVGESSIRGMSDAISRMMDTLNSEVDTDVTIRPVLDLTDVRSGSGMMRSMLTSPMLALYGKNFSLSGGYTQELAASISQDTSGTAGMIGHILDHIDMLSGDIQAMQLVMDSGALVGAISTPMDNALGRMATYRGRGN